MTGDAQVRGCRTGWLCGLALLASCVVAVVSGPANAMPKDKLAQYAALPDWSGVWRLKGTPALLERGDLKVFQPGIRDRAPYKPDWAARYEANARRAENQGDPNDPNPIVDTHTIYCLAGMPRVIATPFEYQFVNAPGASWIIIGGEVRTIFTDGRKRAPDDVIWPKYYGWSLGRWDGETLVVETTNIQGGLWADPTPMVLSDQAVIHERIGRVDADTMQDEVVIEDPVAFTGPWKFTRQYRRIDEWPDEKEICGGKDDRNPIEGGRVTVKLK